MFFLSDERYKYNESLLIQVYVALYVLTLTTAISLFLKRLDHLGGLVTAVLSSNLASILASYETIESGTNTIYKHPFESIGITLVSWSLIACIMNASPGVIRASKKAFLLPSFDKNGKLKIIVILVVFISSIPAFTISLFLVEQIVIPRDVIYFLFEFWLFYLPLVFAVLLGIAWIVDSSYPKDALKLGTWIKILIIIYLLNLIALLISAQAISVHNNF